MRRRSTRLIEKNEILFPSAPTIEQGTKRKAAEDMAEEGRPNAKKALREHPVYGNIVGLPLDVFFEICSASDPIDLLQLARTSKDLRSVLMSRSSITVWKKVFSNIEDLPACPEDLTEPQYANLVFDEHCHVCLRSRSKHISWSARVRCCDKCVSTYFKKDDGDEMQKQRDRGYPAILVDWIPFITVIRSMGYRTSKYRYTLKSVEKLWKAEYSKIAISANAKNEHNWVALKLEERRAIESHARDCEIWSMKVQTAQKFDPVRRAKLLAFHYFKELGGGVELYALPPTKPPVCYAYNVLQYFNTHSLESAQAKTKDLFLDSIKHYRARRLTKIFLQGSLTTPGDTPTPTIGELYCLTTETPGLVDYSQDFPEAVLVHFPELILQNRNNIEIKLRDLIFKACPDYMFDPTTILDLATTIFYCGKCAINLSMHRETGMHHIRASVHACATSITDQVQVGNPLQKAMIEAFGETEWNLERAIVFIPEIMRLASRVVTLCGFDPKTATAQEMDLADPILECLSCNDIRKGRATMSWTTGIIHHLIPEYRHSTSSTLCTTESVKMMVLGDEEAQKVRERLLEETARMKRQCLYYQCAHCKNSARERASFTQMRMHVKNQHRIPKPTSKDMILCPDQDQLPLYYLWPPRDEDLDLEEVF